MIKSDSASSLGHHSNAFSIAIFSNENPQQPQVYNYSPTAETDDAIYYNLDTLPKEAIKAINVLHEANTLAITQQKKRHLSPIVTNKVSSLNQFSAGSSGSKKSKNKNNSSPSLRHLKNTQLALQEKAKYYKQQRLININNDSAAAEVKQLSERMI